MELKSKIGLGTYRMTLKNHDHLRVVQAAIDNGLNLFDTAPNYWYGESEAMLGQFKSSRGTINISSKVGYVVGEDISNLSPGHYVKKLGNDCFYCIDKDYIRRQIETSLHRMNTDYLDIYFLHNPEYLLEQLSLDDFISKILDSLEELNNLYVEGKIKAYGISSNILFNDNFNEYDLIFSKLLPKFHNSGFQFIQFPFNFNEAGILDNMDVIKLRSACNIKFISNRPLNTAIEGRLMRFASYGLNLKEADFFLEENLFQKYLLCIQNIYRRSNEGDSLQHPVMRFLSQKRLCFYSEASLQNFLDNQLLSFYKKIKISKSDKEFFSLHKMLVERWKLITKNNIETDARHFLKETRGLELSDNIAKEAIQFCLDSGIDHVLTGARRMNYIDTIVKLI